jgi:beta-phosphoglucomutase-like phosphatase (HAD superfamily)
MTMSNVKNSNGGNSGDSLLLEKSSIIGKEHIDIQGIIFDLDGTLLDTERLSDAATYEAFGDAVLETKKSQFGNVLPWEIKSKIMGMPGSTWIPMVIDYLLEHWGVNVIAYATPPVLSLVKDDQELIHLLRNRKPGDTIPSGIVNEFWKRWEENLNKLCASVMECQGATQLVQALHSKKIPMAIATSSRMAAVQQKRIK